MTRIEDTFEVKESDASLKILFSSSMIHIDAACASVTLFLDEKGKAFIPHLFAINLVMREGLTNAVRHGNKNDPVRMVDFELEIVRDSAIHVRIEDQGTGFDWKSIQVNKLPDEEDHGRGMPIMHTYFNQCSYNPKGNVLYLEKQILSQV